MPGQILDVVVIGSGKSCSNFKVTVGVYMPLAVKC